MKDTQLFTNSEGFSWEVHSGGSDLKDFRVENGTSLQCLGSLQKNEVFVPQKERILLPMKDRIIHHVLHIAKNLHIKFQLRDL